MSYDEDKVDDFTLALMHLVKHKQRKSGPLRAWKGFDWDTLDRLHENGYISDPKSKAKSVRLSEEGAEKSRELFERFFADESDQPSSGADDNQPVVEPRWRDDDWTAPTDADEMEIVELPPRQLQTLSHGFEGSPETYFLDTREQKVDSFFDPDAFDSVGMVGDEELLEEGRETRREVESNDRYVVIPEEGSREAWRIMRDFISFVTDDHFRDLLENAIHGKGAFRRFKDILARHGEARELFFEYRGQRREHRMRDICAARGLLIRKLEDSDEPG